MGGVFEIWASCSTLKGYLGSSPEVLLIILGEAVSVLKLNAPILQERSWSVMLA